jgi:hypothetical protein
MRVWGVTASAGVLFLLAMPTYSAATVVQDASCPPPREAVFGPFQGDAGNARLAQTFTVQNSGRLTSGQFDLFKSSGSTGDYVMQILELDASGTPTNTVLASTTIPNSTVPSDFSVITGEFTDPIPVTAGQEYALVLTRPGSTQLAAGERFGDCPGSFFFSTSQTGPFAVDDPDGDLVFATFVDVDDDPPETTITKGPKPKTRNRNATLEFVSDEPGSSLECSLDGQSAFRPCSSPLTVRVRRGKHTFQVQATDAAGNVDSTPATYDWKVKRKRKK